ncbi:diguanylate cyclase domain-containing protein [Ruminococcus sp. 5_1_39BFAA]|uniref:diguanylate cyclase domain-containing protein n=1 Tax=Ruminococcus sp. 5_1_39BFAA TaxID=457412 RepID=UPI0035634F5B
MRTLQKIISRYMYQVAGILVAAMLVIVLYIDITNEQELARESAMRTFMQMEQVLEENQKELEEIREEYKETSLHNAEVIARLIESDPNVVDSVQELRKIAASVEVDEIHIFDTTGRIVAGTHPEYYDYTFDSGEQMMFFKPMLEDKSLKLVQDIMPNTAEGKQMQYSALWSSSGEFIVQVGMAPVNVIKVTEKNRLSYIFSLFRVNPEINYYAIDAESGKIVGSADLESVGRSITEIGLTFDDITNKKMGFEAMVNGQHSFCVFKKIGSNYIGRVVSSRNLYRRLPAIMLMVFVCLLVSALFLANAVIRYMNKYVVDEIHDVNKKLKAIANGKLDETVDIQNSIEFAELSKYINAMVKSLLDNNKKMSYVLSKTNLYIGVYEYNKHMEKVRFTDYMPRLFSLDKEEMERLSSDIGAFREFIDKIRENPMADEMGVYKVGEQYIRLEEIRDGNEIFGVAVDATTEIMRLKKTEAERDIDLLTGLYNRRGLDIQLADLSGTPEKLGYCGMIMIDADGLKEINDTYGHEAGDIYLKKLAELIYGFGTKSSIASRQGGDEFVLFLYDYESEEALQKTIEILADRQDHSSVKLGEDLEVPLGFSFGYCLAKEETDYQRLFKEADQKMYKNKLERKKNMA